MTEDEMAGWHHDSMDMSLSELWKPGAGEERERPCHSLKWPISVLFYRTSIIKSITEKVFFPLSPILVKDVFF